MLKTSVAPFAAQMREMAELFAAEQPELDQMVADVAELVRQFYIKSATYSLPDWEREFGLVDGSAMDLDTRRARLLAKLNAATPATVQMLINLVRETLGEDKVEIVEYPAEYRFKVIVRPSYLTQHLTIAKRAVHDARPAHLDYSFLEILAREACKTLYAGAAGGHIVSQDGTVDMDGLYKPLYAGVAGGGIRMERGDVQQ